MDKKTLEALLLPLIEMKQKGGYTPEEWWATLENVAGQIPNTETQSALTLLKGMFHDPGNPASPEHDTPPGSHGLYQVLAGREIARARAKERK